MTDGTESRELIGMSLVRASRNVPIAGTLVPNKESNHKPLHMACISEKLAKATSKANVPLKSEAI